MRIAEQNEYERVRLVEWKKMHTHTQQTHTRPQNTHPCMWVLQRRRKITSEQHRLWVQCRKSGNGTVEHTQRAERKNHQGTIELIRMCKNAPHTQNVRCIMSISGLKSSGPFFIDRITFFLLADSFYCGRLISAFAPTAQPVTDYRTVIRWHTYARILCVSRIWSLHLHYLTGLWQMVNTYPNMQI